MIEVKLKLEFPLGAIVKIKNNPTQVAPMVTDIKISPLGATYGVSYNGGCSWHYANELEYDEAVPRQFGFMPYHHSEEKTK